MARPPKDDDEFVAAAIIKLRNSVPLHKVLSWQSKADRDRIRRKIRRRMSVETSSSHLHHSAKSSEVETMKTAPRPSTSTARTVASVATPAAAGTPLTTAMSELATKLAGVRERRAVVNAEILLREQSGEHVTAAIREPEDDRRGAALEMLNGSAEGRIPTPKKKRQFSDLVEEQAVLDRALEIGGKLHEQLRIQSLAELGEARSDQHRAALRRQALAVIELERSMQAVDVICKGTSLQAYTMPMLGRVANTGSEAHRLLAAAARFGWLSQSEFSDAYQQALTARDT